MVAKVTTMENAVEIAARNILALMLNDTTICQRMDYEYDLRPEFMPTPLYRAVFTAVQTLRARGAIGALNGNAVSALCQIAPDILAGIACEGIDANGKLDRILLEHLSTDAGIVLESGKRTVLRNTLLSEAAKLLQGQSFDETLSQALTALALTGTRQGIDNEYASQNGAMLERLLNESAPPAIATGINSVDGITGGFTRGHLWSVISAMKMRKTTLALNWILGALFAHPDLCVSFYSAEMQTVQVVATLCAMLAIGWQLKRGLYVPHAPTSDISGARLIRARNDYKKWGNVAAESVSEGIKLYKGLQKRLSIYDSQTGIATIADVQRLFKRSVAINGASLHLFDYFTCFRAPGSTVAEQAHYAAQSFQTMAKADNCTLVVLGQKNAKSIEGSADAHMVGAMGGIALEAASDFVWTTHYNPHTDASQLKLTLKLARYSAVGGMNVALHPASGLVLDASWIARI